MKHSRLIGLCLLLGAATLFAQDGQRKLEITLDDWPPLSYEENGVAKGAVVEIVSRIMERLEIPCEMTVYPFTRAWMLAEKGKADAMAIISYQPYRDETLLFSDDHKAFLSKGIYPTNYIWKGEFFMFAVKDRAGSFVFKGYDDPVFQAQRIGIVREYSYNEEFREAEMNRVTLPSPQAAMQALVDGKVDLVPMEYTAGCGILKEMNLQDKVKPISPAIFTKPYHFAFVKNSDYPGIESLPARFEAELAKMHASGEFESIYLPYVRPLYLDEISRPIVFVCEEWIPFEYAAGDKVKGVDAAVVEHIMKRLDLEYRIELYPWSRAWMMAEKGKADAVLSISYKEAREAALYYTDDQRAFAKSGKAPENYLWMSEYVFFVMKKEKDKFKFESYEQLKKDGVRIGRNRDYTYNPEFMAAGFEGPLYATCEDGMLALVAGKIDLYPMDKTVGAAALAKLGLSDSVDRLPKPMFTKPYLSPFCRSSDLPNIEEVMKCFYTELRLMRESGKYEELYNQSINELEAVK